MVKMMKYKVNKTYDAKPISYDSTKKRDYKSIKAIVVHFTAVKNDSALNEVRYFALNNTREAGANFFIDRKGNIERSIPICRTAWSVGGNKYLSCYTSDGGKYYDKYNNYNTVSIELCDIVDHYPSRKQLAALAHTIKYIKKFCPNIQEIIRHYDVNGKPCPSLYCGSAYKNKKWEMLLKYLKKHGC